MRLRIPMRRAALFAAMFAVALIAFLPLRMVMVGGVAARAASGSVWAGHLTEARIGPALLGDLDARLSPLALLSGKARLTFARQGFDAALVAGSSRRAAEGVTGIIPLESLPIASFEATNLTVRFRDGMCESAEGLVRANTDRGGLDGAVRCDRGALLLPLASASGQDRLELRVMGDGAYRAVMAGAGPAMTLSGRF